MASTPYCSPAGFTLTVTGSNFDNASVVKLEGFARARPRLTTLASLWLRSCPRMPRFPGLRRVRIERLGDVKQQALTLRRRGWGQVFLCHSINMLSPTSVPAETTYVYSRSDWQCTRRVLLSSGTESALPLPMSAQHNSMRPVPAAVSSPQGPATSLETVNITVFTLAPGGGHFRHEHVHDYSVCSLNMPARKTASISLAKLMSCSVARLQSVCLSKLAIKIT